VPVLQPAFSEIPVLILPGYGGSGPEHWQTLWESAHPNFRRVEESDWDVPVLADWVDALDAAVWASGPGTVLVAHSLACLQVAHWVALQSGPEGMVEPSQTLLNVRAALLVAVPDPDSSVFPDVARGFAPVPQIRFPFPALVVGSTNDPYATPRFSTACAMAWGTDYESIGDAGHINASSGLGTWETGLGFLGRVVGD
jgi:predicted alpha/beta hydrolase family esterase